MSKWKMVRLGEVCDVRDGTHESPEYNDEGYPLITSKNLINGRIDLSTINYISENDYAKINLRSNVDNGDIIMPMIGTIGNPVIVEKSFDFAIKNVALIKFFKANDISNKYIVYLLKSTIFLNYIDKENRGGTQKFLSLKNIRDFSFPLPPLEEQKRIADILDKTSNLIDLRKQQLEKMDLLVKSKFIDIFGDPVTNPKGWEVKQLADFADIIMGQSPNGEAYNENGIGTPLLNGPTEFGEKYPSEKQWTSVKTKTCNKGDILFCVRGATAGRMNFADKEYCIGRGLAAIRGNKNISNAFIYVVLKNMYEVFQNTSNGSTFININKEQLSSVPIFMTTDKLQDQYLNFVEQVEEQKAVMKQSLEKMETNYKALMQEYF